MASIKVLVADDHHVVRQGLCSMLASADDIEFVGEAENGCEAVRLAKSARPDVVVMDLAMPIMDGIEATKRIVRAKTGSQVLALSSYSGEETVAAMISVGARGYLSKHSAGTELLKAIREVAAGRVYFGGAILERRKREEERKRVRELEGKGNAVLTAREEQVLGLVAAGFKNREMAQELGISVKTIEKHRQMVMDKLGIHETAGLTRYVLEKGLRRGKCVPVKAPEWRQVWDTETSRK